MSTNGISGQYPAISVVPRRRNLFISSLAFRILIAFIISWIIVLAFFVSGAVSR